MSQYLGDISAYALAVSQGYTGTEEEYAELMASYATVGQTAVTAAQTATTKASEAATSATTATTKASEATTAATTATTKAGEASTSASTATSAKDTAVSASQTATTKATEATTAAATATSAKTDAVAANTAAQSAKTAAQTAQTGAETAAASVSASAAQIATNAEDISQLKSDLTAKADATDMLKAFPTDTASGAIASFSDGANVPVKSLVVNIDPVQSGSGDPSPTNVRPISGWSEVNVEHTGANVWDEEWEAYTASQIMGKNPIPLVGGATYYIKSPTSINLYVQEHIGGQYIDVFDGRNKTYTVPQNGHYAYLYTATGYGDTYNHDISINYPSTDHDYHPYSGQSISIALGQTVYGGKLDVLNGVLTPNMDKADMGTLAWARSMGADGVYVFSTSSVSAKAIGVTNVISDTFVTTNKTAWNTDKPNNSICGSTGSNAVVVRADDYADAASFKAAMSGHYIAYEVANPTTVQLTPHEVTTLLGSNNVWADSGDSTVEYRADPTLYIGRLTEPDADMVADSNITSGQYFMVGNTLYKATANIASGATIVPNVNCTRKSLSEALNELNV